MKQSWQRLPGLDSDTLALVNSLLEPDEGVGRNQPFEQELQSILFEEFILRHANLDSHLEVAGFVQIEGRNVETLTYIWKGINAKSEPKPGPEPKKIPKLKHTGDQKSCSNSLKTWRRDLTRTTTSQRARTRAPALISCTLARIVLRIPGPKVIECANMTEFLNGFREALEGEFSLMRNYTS